MRSRKLILLFALITGLTAEAFSQEEVFRGMVADSASFSPLPYVTVRIKNQSKGTTTDAMGNFSITATQLDTLVLTLVGYEPAEVPLVGWEPSMILMTEKVTMLRDITITDTRIDNPYEGMFDEQNEQLRKANKGMPFYYSKAKKQKIRLGRLENENARVKTYVDVVVKNDQVKQQLMDKHGLNEEEYYSLLTQFNTQYYSVMYYLTAGELLTMLNNFFARNAPDK